MTSSDYRKLSVLLGNIRSGSRDAFASVYEMYEKKVYFLLCKITGSKAQAGNLAVDLFDYVYLKLGNLSDPADFERWLYTTLFSKARLHLIEKRPELYGTYADTDSPCGEDVDELLSQDYDEMLSYPEGIDISVDMMRTVDTVLSELPLKLRTAVLQYYFCGFDMEEIAAAEQISVQALKNRLYKARIEMKTQEHKFTELGYDCMGLVVFLPDILSVMAESIVMSSAVAVGVTSRTGIKCISDGVQGAVNGFDGPTSVIQNKTAQTRTKNNVPTSYAVEAAPKRRFSDDISPTVKVIMAIVAILIIIGGTVAVVLAVQGSKNVGETGSVANVENIPDETTTLVITTKPVTTETTTEEESTTAEETTTEPETTTEAETTTEQETTTEAETTTEQETTTEPTADEPVIGEDAEDGEDYRS